MSAPLPVKDTRLGPAGGFVAACRPEHLIYFLLNVGDGDTQLLLLPADSQGRRQAIVVDVAGAAKLKRLVDELAATALMPTVGELFVLVVATHPHDDHIGGMATFLDAHADHVGELWEPGYYHPSAAYLEMMRAVEEHSFRHLQPASGTTRFVGRVKITVLAPGIVLRNRFDSYGIDINNSSIALKVEYPAARVLARRQDRTYVKLPTSQALILGGDAQTLSWAQVMVDFPQLGPDKTAVSDALRKARGFEPLDGNLFKIPHHGSKHGLNLELIETVAPQLSLISSVGSGGKYNFPHEVSQGSLREGLEAIASNPAKPRSEDCDLGIHYTAGTTDAGTAMGSMAVLISDGGSRQLWRFMDAQNQQIKLANARPFA